MQLANNTQRIGMRLRAHQIVHQVPRQSAPMESRCYTTRIDAHGAHGVYGDVVPQQHIGVSNAPTCYGAAHPPTSPVEPERIAEKLLDRFVDSHPQRQSGRPSAASVEGPRVRALRFAAPFRGSPEINVTGRR